MRQKLASFVQVAGLCLVAAAGFIITAYVGLAVLGAAFIIVGVALERDP